MKWYISEIINEKMENYQELADLLKGSQEDLCDKTEISVTCKFSNLKEFLVPKVRVIRRWCSFYILMVCNRKVYFFSVKFEKCSEVTTAYIQCITSLPVVSNSNPNKIPEFFEKLSVSVQALDTVNKLRDI